MNKSHPDFLFSASLKTLLAESDEYIFIKDREFRNRGSSLAFCHTMGAHSPEELLGKTDYQLFDKALADKYRQDDLLVIKEGRSLSALTEQAPSPNGKNCWVRTWKYPIKDGDGKIIGLLGVGRDFTEEVTLSEQAKIDSEYHRIVDSLPGGIAMVHLEGEKIFLDFANAGYFHILNLTLEEGRHYLGSDIAPSIYEEDLPELLRVFPRLEAKESEEITIDYRIVTPHRHLHWLRNQIRKAYSANGNSYFSVSGTNIDEKKNAEMEALKTQRMYDDAATEAKLIIWTYDPEKKTVTMIKEGYTAEICSRFHIRGVIENVPDSLLPFVKEEDRPIFQGIYSRIDEGSLHSEGEFRFRLPGVDHWQYERMSFRRITDEKGRLLTVHCCGQNITEQKEEEEQYDFTNEQLRKSYPNSLGSFHLNLTQNRCGEGESPLPFILRQQASGTVDGYFAEFAKLIADETIRQAFFERFQRLKLIQEYEAGNRKISFEYPIVYADGIHHWREGDLFLLKNPKTGDIEGWTFDLDIDQKKRNTAILNRLINANLDYIGIIHPQSETFEFQSRRSSITFGQIGQLLAYDDCCAFVRKRFSDPREAEFFDQAVNLPGILKDLRKNGSRSVSYVNSAGGKPICSQLQYCWLEKPEGDILMIRNDITEAYLKEQDQLRQIRASLLEANRANESKSAFLSSVSHDLRTPLNGVIGFTDLALQEKDPAKKEDYLEKIKLSGQLLLDLVNDTLEISRIESGKYELSPENVDSHLLIQSVLDALRPSAEGKGVTLVDNLNDFSPETLHVDKLKLQKIILNLLSNAIKFTPKGGSVRFSLERHDDAPNGLNRRFKVADTGIGMSKEFVQEHLFEPFSQERRPGASQALGTGLGLSIAKRIIDLMGGTIKVESAIGKGTTFTVDLPLQIVEGKSEAPKEKIPERSLKGKKVLLCEDNALNAEIASVLLKERGLWVDWAKDGEEGLTVFKKAPDGNYDAVLMDIRMPNKDGYEATKAIRALPREDAKKVPIIAMTADAFEENILMAKALGMNDYITKPIEPAKLFRILEKWIAK
jgi:PAS domain S-box-containing protein